MNGRTTIQITLVVKGERAEAVEEIYRRLQGPLTSWFAEEKNVPYPVGSLLWYGMTGDEEGVGHLCPDCQDASGSE